MSEPWEDFASSTTTATAPSSDAPPWEDFQNEALSKPVSLKQDPNLVSTIAGGTKGGGLNLQPFTKADLPDASDIGELYQDVSRPAVKLPKFTIDPKDSKIDAVAKSAANLIVSVPEFMESPLGVATAGSASVIPKVVAALFLGDTAKNVVEGSKEAGKNWDEMTDAEKAAAATDLAGQTVLAAAMAHGAAGGVADVVDTRVNPAGMLARELNRTQPKFNGETPPTPIVSNSGNPWDDFKQAEAPAEQTAKMGEISSKLVAPTLTSAEASTPETKVVESGTEPANSGMVEPKIETKSPVDTLGEGIDFANIQKPHLVGIEAGMNLAPDDVPALKERQKGVSDAMVKAAETGEDFQSLFGEATFLGGAIEAANKKGPNWDLYQKMQAEKSSPPPEAIPTVPTETVPQAGLATPNLTPTAAGESLPTPDSPDLLTHGDEVQAILPNGEKVQGHIIGADDAGNPVLLKADGKTVTLPEKITEVPDENKKPENVQAAENPPARPVEEIPVGKPGEVQQPAENPLVENPGLPPQEAAGGIEANPNLIGAPETYGIAQRVREARAEAGQSVPVPTGQGIAPEASVGRGRQLLSEGANPEKALADFEATKRFSSDDIALVRARGEQLAQMARDAEQKHGVGSNEYKIASHLLADWDTRSKAMQTEWHKSGQAQQGETDIDTGTFTGLQRAFRDATGKDFTPEQEKTAKKHAEKNKTAEVETEQAKQKLFSTLDEETKPKESPKKEEPVEPHVRLIADKLKAYFEDRASSALDRIKKRRSEGRLFTGIDPAELADYADYGASKILQKGLEVEKMSEEWAREMAAEIGDYIKPHLETIWKASQKMLYEGFKKNIGIGEQSSKVKKAIKSDSKDAGVNASKKALEAAQKTVREAAVKAADAEVKARTASAKSAKDAAEVQRQATRKALEAATKRSREAATKLAESERARNLKQAAIDSFGEPGSLDEVRKMIAYRKPGEPFAPNQVRAIWNYAKRTYIEKGVTNFDDVRAKLATDLGISIADVTKALAQPKGAKRLTDELWKKQQAARRVQQQAKEFIRTTEMPGYVKALSSIPKILFGLKVGFHGTVALGTHAPFVAFQPNFWKVYFQDFAKMYKMVGSPAFYEREAQDLFRRPNFTLATRAGLVNDPFKVEDFNNPALSQYLGALTGMGNRGYFVLKILRQDMFDQMWNQLPETAQVPEVATAISDGINHATGVIKAGAPTGSNLALFAPRLEGSRVAWLAVDPTKALMSAVNWKNATPAEKIFAINQAKEKAWVAGTLFGLLAFNAGILSATGSKQQINFNNPMRSDFLKFKGAGMDFSYGNAMLSMARLPVRLFQIRESNGGKLKNLIYPDEDTYSVLGEYARSQLSPFASLASTLWFKSDWQNRPLPNSERPVPKRLAQQGVKPYTWKEFWLEQILPIPFEEATREVWQHGLGMNPDQVSAMRRMVATVAVMSATGGRLTEDTNIKK